MASALRALKKEVMLANERRFLDVLLEVGSRLIRFSAGLDGPMGAGDTVKRLISTGERGCPYGIPSAIAVDGPMIKGDVACLGLGEPEGDISGDVNGVHGLRPPPWPTDTDSPELDEETEPRCSIRCEAGGGHSSPAAPIPTPIPAPPRPFRRRPPWTSISPSREEEDMDVDMISSSVCVEQ